MLVTRGSSEQGSVGSVQRWCDRHPDHHHGAALHAPEHATWAALLPLWPVFLSYLLSFVFLAIYWNNHHHLLQAIEHVDGRVLWANMHLLFWLSLIPFATAWMGQNRFEAQTVALYGVVLLSSAVAYFILTKALLALHGTDSVLATALGGDLKTKISLAGFLVAIPLSFLAPWIACTLYVLVTIMWLVPDRRIEKTLVS